MKKIIITTLLSLFSFSAHATDYTDTDQIYGWNGAAQFWQTWADHKTQLSTIYLPKTGGAMTGTLDLGVASTTTGLAQFYNSGAAYPTGLYSLGASVPSVGLRLPGAMPTGNSTFSVDTNGYMGFWTMDTDIVTGVSAGDDTVPSAKAVDTALDAKEPTQTAASQAEVEAGTEAAIRSVSPLRLWQSIAAYFAANVATVSADVETMMGSANNAAIRSNIGVAAKYVSGTEADFYGTLLDPQAIYAVDGTNHAVTIITNTPAAFTITAIRVTCDADPTTEQTLTFQHKAAGVGYGTPTTIEAVVTTAGVANITSGIDDATIPINTKVFVTLSDPDDALNECAWQIEGDWD